MRWVQVCECVAGAAASTVLLNGVAMFAVCGVTEVPHDAHHARPKGILTMSRLARTKFAGPGMWQNSLGKPA